MTPIIEELEELNVSAVILEIMQTFLICHTIKSIILKKLKRQNRLSNYFPHSPTKRNSEHAVSAVVLVASAFPIPSGNYCAIQQPAKVYNLNFSVLLK